MTRKILCVIDTQNDFIDGSLGSADAAARVPDIINKINAFDGDVIYVTQDTHEDNYLETREGQILKTVHCVKDTDGWNINSNIQGALNNAVFRGIDVIYIEKPTFGSYDLITYMQDDMNFYKDDDFEIEFIGFCTDICVVSNVLLAKAAFYNKADIKVDANCCAGATPSSHDAALLTMYMCQVNVLNKDF